MFRVPRLAIGIAVLLLTLPLAAKDVYLPIGGSVGVFRTDTRILNPSPSKDIHVQAWLLAVGNVDNTAVQPKTITIPKRQMLVLDDVLSSLFQASGLAAIRLSSPDDFVATQRIYAQTEKGTLGQFVPGIDASQSLTSGVLLQLKVNSVFRTNAGAVNPNAVPATVTWRLHDRDNNLAAVGSPIVMPPYAVISPTTITSGFFFNAAGADLGDAWVSFTSDQPIVAYGSVIDGGTEDPTYVGAVEDTGEDPAPPPAAKSFNISARQFTFDINPPFSVQVGDEVTLNISSDDVVHGFTLLGPDGRTIIPATNVNPGQSVVRTFTAETAGTHSYFCTNSLCGSGHSEMSGAFTVATKP